MWSKLEWPQELKDLCNEFSDILVEELSQAQNIQCPPMDVELQAGAKPFFARKLRKTPLHWGEKVKKEVKKLLNLVLSNAYRQKKLHYGYLQPDLWLKTKRRKNYD